MSAPRTFSAETEADLWAPVAADLARLDSALEYNAHLNLGPYQGQLDIDIDPGGGFESGFTQTALSLRVPGQHTLRFALYEQTWLQEIGKLLGQEDVVLGYPDLDEAFIITTNDAVALKDLFADATLRQTLLRFPALRLTLEPASLDAGAPLHLTFTYDEVLLSAAQLQEVYHALLTIVRWLSVQP